MSLLCQTTMASLNRDPRFLKLTSFVVRGFPPQWYEPSLAPFRKEIAAEIANFLVENGVNEKKLAENLFMECYCYDETLSKELAATIVASLSEEDRKKFVEAST